MSRIKTINPNREWESIRFETHYNKPLINGSYPKDIVRKRELLLFAQCFLADYQTAKTRKYKSFYRELYRTTMNAYFNWWYDVEISKKLSLSKTKDLSKR